MNVQKHIINRHILELTVPEQGRVQSIQTKASELIKQKLYPELDDLFSKIMSPDQVIRIDKLVIDVGKISEHDLDNEFIDRSLKKIADKINGLLATETNARQQNHVNVYETEIYGKILVASRSHDYLHQFIYFLQTGHFPWWKTSSETNKVSGDGSLKEVFAEVLKYESNLLKNELVPLFKIPSVRKRLIFQFDYSRIGELLNRIDEKKLKNCSTQFQVLLSVIGSCRFEKTFTDSYYDVVLQNFSETTELNSEERKTAFTKDVLDSVMTRLSESDKEWIVANRLKQDDSGEISVTKELYHFSEAEKGAGNSGLESILDNSEKNWKTVSNLFEDFIRNLAKKTTGKTTINLEPNREKNKNYSSEPETEIKNKKEEKKLQSLNGKNEMIEDQIVVFNAGLVLIHPFLRFFFEGLDLLDEKLSFKSQEHAFKAIHLLQFIATGNETAVETDLLLNKILCGVDISEPVPNCVILSEKEKEESVFLIKTVLERWEALKTTNPSALRETFIQREGILKKSGGDWTLVIERNTFDVMLEKLLWSISFIKLPWCQQILFVEW